MRAPPRKGGALAPGSLAVGLAADELEAASGDAVGTAGLRTDRPPALQPAEELELEARHQPAVAVPALHRADAAAVAFERADLAALRQRVKHALFLSGNVHVRRLRLKGQGALPRPWLAERLNWPASPRRVRRYRRTD